MTQAPNRTKRSFALKKRGASDAQEVIEEVSAAPQLDSETQAAVNEELLYQGEVFDQFYRPIRVTDGLAGLTSLAREDVSRPTPASVRRVIPSKARVAELKEGAEALSHQIYKLSQKLRETDIDVYLSAFNLVVGSRPIKDAKELLDYANAFFTEHYYVVIRERGERPEIFQQIVKRTGHATAERIRKIVNGLDVESVSRSLWDLYHSADPEKVTKITNILMDCTPLQVRALREEFFFIPYRDLAQQMWTILHRSEGEGAVKKTIGRTEIQEQRKKVFAKSRDDAAALTFILAGRTRDEISLILHCYENIFHNEGLEPLSVEDEVRKRLQPGQAKQVLKLLNGWNAEEESDEIHVLLFQEKPELLPKDALSDTRDPVERDFNTGLLNLNRKFRKRKILREFTRMKDRIVSVFELLEERIYPLSATQLETLQTTHERRHGYSLPLDLFTSHRTASPRLLSKILEERLETSRSVSDLMRPLFMLTPKQILAVSTAFHCSTGRVLSEAIIQRAKEITLVDLTPEQEFLFELSLTGRARAPLSLDLLARYRDEEPPADIWDVDYTFDEATEQSTLHLAELINSLLPVGETLSKIREIFRAKDATQRSQVERAFFEFSDPQTPLIASLDGPSHGAEEDYITLLLLGYDVETIVSDIMADPAKGGVILENGPRLLIDTVRNLFEARTGVALLDFVEKELEPGPELYDLLTALLTPESYDYHQVLFDIRKDKPALLEDIREPWSWSITRRHAFERAYDTLFPRLRIDLKFAHGRGALPLREFVNAILHLEGVSPDVIEQIVENFDAVDINGMLVTLDQNRLDQNVIEECYDLLNPENTLRRSIKAMQVPLDKINETLLHVEGYYPKDVAAEMGTLVQSKTGEELGLSILELVTVNETGPVNERIPTDINWIDEMNRQIALAFGQAYNVPLLEKLRNSGVPVNLLEKITEKVFGADISGYARELFDLITRHMQGITVSDAEEDRLATFIEMRGIRFRELIAQAYRAHWEKLPNMGLLLDDIQSHVKNPVARQKLVTSLSPPKVKTTGDTIPALQIPASAA